ncbi:MAG: hypothetical protein KC656_03380 [Myxococcales bacterium]|nr:hypothetical protein [Myxococcales bacterium]
MFLLTAMTLAHAGPCDAKVASIEGTPREKLTTLYAEVVDCDPRAADSSFKAFVRASGDVDTLVDLSLKAIELEQYQPVWDMLEQLTDREARRKVAERVGGLCQDQVGVLPFLQGGYFAANERAFAMWSQAYDTCSSEALTDWMREKISDPPTRTYDDRYNSLLDAFVGRLGEKALGPLERAAVAASERGGPFTSILEKMLEAVRPPGIGAELSDDRKRMLADAYVRVGTGGVRPEQAAAVADRLYQQGFKDRAASLLKVVYGDRVQADGRLLYGVASVEHCGGEAVVHLTSVYEPSRRWTIQPEIDAPVRAFKKRLKCETSAPWDVHVTRSPVANVAEVAAHGEEIARIYSDRNLVVRVREEKPLELQ